jgi:hypothetical protein
MRSMKNMFIALSLVAAVALPMVAFAAKTPKTKKGATADSSASSTTAPALQSVELEGTITKVDDNGNVTFTIKVPTNSITTTITIDGSTKTVHDLKTNETVKVTFAGTSTTPSTIAAKTPAPN